MADTIGGVNFVGETRVVKLDLINYNGYRIDIQGIVAEINLFEDLFSNTLSATLAIADATALAEILPIMGEELVEMELETPSLSQTIKRTFYVYKMSDVDASSQVRNKTYLLHLISKEAINSANRKIAKAYSGKISDTVDNVFRDVKGLESKKALFIEPTRNSFKFIATYWSPLQTINWLAERAINANGVANYLFFETNNSFEFVSLEKLMTSPINRDYVFSNVPASLVYGIDADLEKKYNIVSNISTDVSFDYLRRVSSGFYGGRLNMYDMTSKIISTNTYDYIKNFPDAKHLDPNPMATPDVVRKKIASQYFLCKNDLLYGEKFDQQHDARYLQRNSLIEQVFSYRINIEVPGRFDIKVGNTIKMTINSFKEFTQADTSDSTTDDYYTGKYLITAIKHIIRNNIHTMNMEVVKDSFAKPLRTQINN